MKTAAIEINDAGLVVAHDGRLEPPSPGYALLAGDSVVVGEAALRAARLEPRNVDNRYWHELDERPLSQPKAGGRSRADLAYAQLSQVWDPLRGEDSAGPQRVACAVAGTARPAQLALILGIARTGQIPISGFIDSAVAVATTWGGKGRFVYIDVHLHHAIGTAVEVGAQARRERVEVAARAGLIALQDLWMRLIARQSIARTRFDPLHQASTEQVLLDALPGCLEALAIQPQVEIEIPFGADRYRVQVTREEFLMEAQPLYEQILLSAHRLRRAGHPLTLALSARAAALPGLAERFAEFQDCEVVQCVPGCAALAAAIHADSWDLAQESASLFRTAPLLPSPIAAPIAPLRVHTALPASRKRSPTHVLYQGKAHVLGAQPLIAGLAAGDSRLQISGAAAGISHLHCSLLRRSEEAEVIDFSRYGTWLNEERIAGRAPLHAGDRVRIGTPGVVLELIAID